MKYHLKYIITAVTAALLVGILISCNDNNEPNGGKPMISYVRVTDPAKSDSLLTGGLLGKLIAIVGENLGGARKVTFNDQEVDLNPTYVTSKSILVSIPNSAPVVVTDNMQIIFANGETLDYSFKIDIPAPRLNSMQNEWALVGETAVINGNYFFEPLTIKLSDGTEVTPSSVKSTQLQFVVPDNPSSGPITVTTNFGQTVSAFHFHDDRNIILNYDDLTSNGSWRSGTIKSEGGFDGNYLLLKGVLGKNVRAEDYGGGGYVSELWAIANGRPEGNLFDGDPKQFALKFEARVIDWYGSYLNICFAPWGYKDNNQEYWGNLNARAIWGPWDKGTTSYKTDGWITVTIPLTEFKYKQAVVDGDVVYQDMQFDKNITGSMTFWVVGSPLSNDSPVEINIDNVRIVPN